MGDVVDHARVLAIERERVWLERGGDRFFLPMTSAFVMPLSQPTPAVDATVAAADLEAAFERPDELARQLMIAPRFDHGVRLLHVAPGSPVARLGLAPGDAIQSVNGVPITSINGALEAALRLGRAREVDLEIQREPRVSSTSSFVDFRGSPADRRD